MHGSVSKSGFKNICVSSDFKHLLKFSEPIVLKDNEKNEGRTFAKLLYENRLQNKEFLSSLCETYVLFLLTNFKMDSNIDLAINKIIAENSDNAYDNNFDVTTALLKSGYAKDYIRNQFKHKTGKTPTQFLTEIRIKRALFLIDIYKENCSLTQIAEQCGFVDYIYFSRRFKQFTGISPNKYRKQTL